jgi:hypothetical protein
MINYTPIGVVVFVDITVVKAHFLAMFIKNNVLLLESIFFNFEFQK